MKKNLTRLAVFVLVLPCLVACNVFAPFQPNSSDNDHLEVALACLNNNADYKCAQSEYNKLSDASLKNRYSCMVDISLAGLTLSNLINIVITDASDASKQTALLGTLANALLPWTTDKADQAYGGIGTFDGTTFAALATPTGFCNDFAADPGSTDLGVLLKNLALVNECALHVARATQFSATDDTLGAGSTCAATGSSAATITQLLISNDSSGLISVAHPGMCAEDVAACVADVTAIDFSGSSELAKIQQGIQFIKTTIPNSGVVQAERAALRTLIP